MLSVGYTQKNTLPKRSVRSRTISDYSPFGVLLPERSVNAEDYRYGYNGMEGDPEVKGKGNSYDFGARILDSRVGRWLTTDLITSKKADQSPFQGFRNNPNVFVDPDGKDEWNSIVLKDQKGNVVAKSFARVSTTKYMSSGIKHIDDGGGGWWNMSNGYDFKNEMTFQIQSDGSIKHIKTEQVLIVNKGIKDREYGGFAKKKGTIYDCGISSTGYEQPGGMYLYSKGGQGTKYYSRKDVSSMDAEDLLTMLGVLGKSDFKDIPTQDLKLATVLDDLKGIAEETGALPKGDDDPSVQSNQKADSKPQGPIVVSSPEKSQNGGTTPLTWKEVSLEEATKKYDGKLSKNKDTLYIKKQ